MDSLPDQPSLSSLEERNERERAFFAEWVINPEGDAIRWRRQLRLLREARPGGLGDVLSLGCGRGQFEVLVAEAADHVVGIDLSEESIEDARARAVAEGIENVEFVCADLVDFEPDRQFDVVLCMGFLHHLSDDEGRALMKNVRAHLRDGGLLHTQDPGAKGILRSIGRVVLGDRYDTYHTPDERELDPDRVAELMREAGFSRADVDYMDVFLIPGLQLFPKAPRLLMSLFALVDRIWCAIPGLDRLASGFAINGRR